MGSRLSALFSPPHSLPPRSQGRQASAASAFHFSSHLRGICELALSSLRSSLWRKGIQGCVDEPGVSSFKEFDQSQPLQPSWSKAWLRVLGLEHE